MVELEDGLCPYCDFEGQYEESLRYCVYCHKVVEGDTYEEMYCSAECHQESTAITCEGCAVDAPNQLAHMNYGGCLYQEY
jgi:hypothetical protein